MKKFIFLLFLSGILSVKAQPFGKLFSKASVLARSWQPFIISYKAKTLETCSVLCLQYPDTCSAFQFVDGSCSLGKAGSIIEFQTSDTLVSTTIWKDGNVPKVPHLLLICGGVLQDISLDPINSPPISLSSYSPFDAYFAYFSGSKLNIYGFSSSPLSYGVTRMMFSASFSSPHAQVIQMSDNHVDGFYTWIGNRVWVVGGNVPPEQTHIYVNGQYMAGPLFPSGAYPDYFVVPCLSSADNNTGIIMFGLIKTDMFSSLSTYTQVRSYNFTSGTWKRLKDSPIKRKLAVCQRVTLANQTSVIFVIGGSTDDGLTYFKTTWIYNIQTDMWYLSKYDLPVGLAFGTTAIVDNRLFYIGGTTGTLSPADNIYEWTEDEGWKFYSKIVGFIGYTRIVAVPYNLP